MLARMLRFTVLLAYFDSCSMLRDCHALPKQAYRAAVHRVDTNRRDGEDDVVVSIASSGMRYYGTAAGWQEGRDFAVVRSAEAFDAAVDALPARRGMLVTTLYGILETSEPHIAGRITRDWEAVAEFRGTLGGGSIEVWRRRAGED